MKTYTAIDYMTCPKDALVKFAEVRLPYGNNLEPHSHYTLEISMIASGTGEYRLDDRVYRMEKGDIILFNNVESHGMRNIDPDNMLVNYALEFEPRFIWTNPGDYFDLNFLSAFFNRNINFENKLDNKNPAFPEIQRLFSRIEQEFRSKPPRYEVVIKAKLLNILAEIIRYYNISDEVNRTEPAKHSHDISMVMDYISYNFNEDISLQKLADMLHMGPSYLSRLFKTANGIGVKEYITKKRVSEAAIQLRTTDKSVTEIATDCGFNSLSNFYESFIKIMGMNPGKYRDGTV